jgi:prevent-host-death family protein
MGNIPATEFKAKCLELMDRVAERHETFVITKRGKPVAKLAPVESKPKDSLFACLRHKIHITGDIITPVLSDKAWETVKEWDELMKRPEGTRRSRNTRSRESGRRR